MTISCLMVHWFEHLAVAGIIPRGGAMLEFGPQDLAAPREVVTTTELPHRSPKMRLLAPAGR